MLRRFLQSFQFLALTVVLAGVAQAQEPYLLRYKLEKGKSQLVQSKVETTQKQSINGMDFDTKIGMTSIDRRDIGDIDTEGVAKLKTKTERLKASGKIAVLGDYQFDSEKKNDRDTSSAIGSEVTPLFERLVGSELQAEVTARGVVSSYTGYSQLVGDLVKDKPLASQFAGGGSDGAAKLSFQGQWIVFPMKAVKPGENWETSYEVDLAGLGTMKGKETVTLVSVEMKNGHAVAKLTTSSDVTLDMKIDMGAAKVSGKLTTSNSMGSAEFDITDGKLLKSSSELSLTGQLSVEAGGNTIPVQVSQTVTAETAALDKLPE